jgi:hypothetical protein
MNPDISRRHLGFGAALAVATASGLTHMAEGAETSGDWFATIKVQHKALDEMLMAVKSAGSHTARLAAFKTFSTYLSAHCLAEEVSVYPALAITGLESASKQLYGEQDDAKVLVARIDDALSMGQDDQVSALLDTLATALHAHVAEEENQDFPALQAKVDAMMNARLTTDFKMAFQRAAT